MSGSPERAGAARASLDASSRGTDQTAAEYETPCVVDIGPVRDVTAGSSSSGTADANSQYYW